MLYLYITKQLPNFVVIINAVNKNSNNFKKSSSRFKLT